MNNGIIYMDEDGSTNDAIFGKPLAATQQWIANSVNNYVSSVGNTVAGVASSLMDRFNQFTSVAALAKVEQMRNRLSGIWETDGVRRLHEIEQFRQASPVMQRWIMAAPRMRSSFNREGCNGYEGSYIDVRPGGVADTHYDYRRVMNGIVENGTYTNYYEPLLSPDDLLTVFEKANIKATWNALNSLLDESNSDPSDPWGNNTII